MLTCIHASTYIHTSTYTPKHINTPKVYRHEEVAVGIFFDLVQGLPRRVSPDNTKASAMGDIARVKAM